MASRGHNACKDCHCRKQKCDEKKPVCSRCRAANRTCVWPGLRKRGPAKGYSDALERRLKETENALLQLLALVDGSADINLETELDETRFDAFRANRMIDQASTKTELMARWQDYPIRTLAELRAWRDVVHPENVEADGSVLSRSVMAANVHSATQEASDTYSEETDVQPFSEPTVRETFTSSAFPQNATVFSDSSYDNASPDHESSHDARLDSSIPQPAVRIQNRSHFALPTDFQNQFVW